eukprot:1182410-Prorocentrum_minimum.AAC.1
MFAIWGGEGRAPEAADRTMGGKIYLRRQVVDVHAQRPFGAGDVGRRGRVGNGVLVQQAVRHRPCRAGKEGAVRSEVTLQAVASACRESRESALVRK